MKLSPRPRNGRSLCPLKFFFSTHVIELMSLINIVFLIKQLFFRCPTACVLFRYQIGVSFAFQEQLLEIVRNPFRNIPNQVPAQDSYSVY